MKKMISKKYRRRLFDSFLILGALMLVVFVTSFVITNKKTEKENKRYCMQIAEIEKKRVDEKIQLAKGIAERILIDDKVNAFTTQKEVNLDNKYDVFIIATQLKNYFVLEKNIDSAFVYYPESDYVIGTNFSGGFFEYCRAFDVKDGEDLKDFLNNNSFEIGIYDGKPVYTVSIVKNNKVTANIAVTLNSVYAFDDMNQKINDMALMDSEGNICVLGGKGEVLYSGIKEKILKDWNDEDDFFSNGSNIGFSISSDTGKLKYVFIIPKAEYQKLAHELWLILLIAIILCAVFGVLTATKLTEKNYSPIRQLARNINNYIETDFEQSDEFDKINTVLNKLAIESKDGKNKWDSYKRIVKDVVYTNLLKGECGHTENIEKKYGRLIEEDFSGEFYAVCMCFIEDISHIFLVNDETKDIKVSNEDYELSKYIVGNVANDIFTDVKWSLLEADNIPTMVFTFDSEEFPAGLNEKLVEYNEILEKQLGIKCFLAISAVHTEFSELSDCYNEILRCCEARLNTNTPVSFFDEETAETELSGSERLIYRLSPENEKRLVNYISNGSAQAAAECVEEIFEQNIRYSNYSNMKIKVLAYHILGIVMNFLDNENRVELCKKLNTDDVFGWIDAANTPKELIGRSVNIVKMMCDEVSEKSNGSRIDLVCNKIKAYIEGNFSNEDLNLSTIAEKFDMSSGYISTIFKKKFGIGISSYLKDERMKKAKELLIRGDIKIKDIAVRVGYSNERSFSRAFRSYFGVAPGEYISMNSETVTEDDL